MEIKPQDYIHLYIGCDVSNGIEIGKLVGVTESEYEHGKTIALIDFGADSFIEWYAEETKPILRNLSDMTEEEHNEVALKLGYGFGSKAMGYSKEWFLEFWNGKGHQMFFHPIDVIPVFTYLLKQGFDLFGLIPAGLAIDKTSLKN